MFSIDVVCKVDYSIGNRCYSHDVTGVAWSVLDGLPLRICWREEIRARKLVRVRFGELSMFILLLLSGELILGSVEGTTDCPCCSSIDVGLNLYSYVLK